MKRSLLLFVLAACGAELSADPSDIFATGFRIDIPQPAADFDFHTPIRLRLDVPIGPVRLNYGTPIYRAIREVRATGNERYSPRLDAPGPGYREQRQRLFGP